MLKLEKVLIVCHPKTNEKVGPRIFIIHSFDESNH
jgi:hypothetical protein